MERDNVAVIGAGPLGLMAIKNLKEAGFKVTCFETRPYIGGLWKDSNDNTLSVQAGTIFNNSKFRAAISDLPFDDDVDDYPTAAQIWDYLGTYADKFDLRRHVRLGQNITGLLRDEDEGFWIVEATETATGKSEKHRFDRVLVATGSFVTPRWPKLEGLEKFQGKVLHSIDFHNDSEKEFKDQNVLTIGMHATAQDISNALSSCAKKVYLSHRHGVIMLPKWTTDGVPSDTNQTIGFVMFTTFFETYFPSFWQMFVDKVITGISDKSYPEQKEWGLRPAPSLAVSTPVSAGVICDLLKSGFAESTPAVKEITGPKTVVLTDGRVLEDIDAIIYCTGYHVNVPESLTPKSAKTGQFLSCNPHPSGPLSGQNPYLYMNMFPISEDPAIRDSLGYVGKAYTIHPGFVQMELQIAAIAQVWRGWRTVPGHAEMVNWYKKNGELRKAMTKKYNAAADSTFYPGLIPLSTFWPYLNYMAGTGFYENLGGLCNGLFNYRTWKLWWQDRELYDLLFKGILSPTVYRVFDMGGRKALPREEAVKRLKKENEAFEKVIATRKAQQDRKNV